MSANKSDRQTLASAISDSFGDTASREQIVAKLRSAAERFYERASLEQFGEMEVFVRSLVARRGLLHEEGSTCIQ